MVSFDVKKLKAKLEKRLKPRIIYLKQLKHKIVKIEQSCTHFFEKCENIVIEFVKNVKIPKLILYECKNIVVKNNLGKIIVALEIIKSGKIRYVDNNQTLKLVQIDYCTDVEFYFLTNKPTEFRILCYNSVYIYINQKLLPVNNWDSGLVFHIKDSILCCVLNIRILYPPFLRRSENIDDFVVLNCWREL